MGLVDLLSEQPIPNKLELILLQRSANGSGLQGDIVTLRHCCQGNERATETEEGLGKDVDARV